MRGSLKVGWKEKINISIGDKSIVRRMENGELAIPFSCGFIIKKIHNFDPLTISVDVLMTKYIFIKLTGLK